MNQYNVGTLVRLTAAITAANVPVTPTTISMKVKNPDMTVSDLSTSIVADSVGNYHVDTTPASLGLYQYEWLCAGNVSLNSRGQFLVNQGAF
jgi:hypothetical protein